MEKDWFDEHIEIVGVDKKTAESTKEKIKKELIDIEPTTADKYNKEYEDSKNGEG